MATKKQTSAQRAASERSKAGWATRRNREMRTFNQAQANANNPKMMYSLTDNDAFSKNATTPAGVLTDFATRFNNKVADVEAKLDVLRMVIAKKLGRETPINEKTSAEDNSERSGIFPNLNRAMVGLESASEMIDWIDQLQTELL